MILRGNIYITSEKDIIFQALQSNDPGLKIISIDEDKTLGFENDRIIPGTILLPPIDAKIAELDGDEQKYDIIYSIHLQTDPVKQYMAGILAFLFNGGRLLIYYPDQEYNNTKIKLLAFIFIIYGVHIGILGDNNPDNATCFYDANLEHFQLDLIFQFTRIIDWRTYLILYPLEFPIPDQILDILFMELHPYGLTLKERLDEIDRLRARLKENPNVVRALIAI